MNNLIKQEKKKYKEALKNPEKCQAERDEICKTILNSTPPEWDTIKVTLSKRL